MIIDPCGDGRVRFAQAMADLPPDEPINEATVSEMLYAPADYEPDLIVVLGEPTRLPPSLVWELAYGELVFRPMAWHELCDGTSRRGDRRLRSTSNVASAGSTTPTSPSADPDDADTDGREPTSMSGLYHDVGVVLRTYKLGESDKIVVIHTLENGKIRAVAKGVRKTRSKFGARLEPMSHVKLLLYRGREFDIVSQAESVESLSPMLSSLDRASQGLAAIEAVDQLSLEREPNPQLYKIARRRPADHRREAVTAECAGVLLEAPRPRRFPTGTERMCSLRTEPNRRCNWSPST